MDIESIDYVSTALGRVTQQYRDKPKFMELVGEYSRLAQECLEDPASNLFDILDIDLMGGHNLDVIGDIVGQSRVLIDYDLLVFFGYDGAPASGTYGDLNNPATGERYLSAFEDSAGDKTLSDPEYRVFIKARILKNYSDSTEPDLAESIKLLLGVDQVKIDEGVMSLDIGVLGELSANELALLQTYDIIPRPTGVEIASVYEYGLVQFNGSSTVIEVPSTTDFDIGANDFEIRCKVKTSSANQAFISKEDSVNHTTASWMAFAKNGMAHFGYSPSDGTFVEYNSGLDISDNVQHSMVVSRSGTDFTIKVDAFTYTDTMTSDPFTGTADFLKYGTSDFFGFDT